MGNIKSKLFKPKYTVPQISLFFDKSTELSSEFSTEFSEPEHNISMLFLGETLTDINYIVTKCIKYEDCSIFRYIKSKNLDVGNSYCDILFNINDKKINLEISMIETPINYYTCGSQSSIYRMCNSCVIVVNIGNDNFMDVIKLNLNNINRDISRGIPKLIVGYAYEINHNWIIQKVINWNELFFSLPKELKLYISYIVNYDCHNKINQISYLINNTNINFIPISLTTEYNINKIFTFTINPTIKKLCDII